MTRRISITDIHSFADTLAVRRAAKGKVVCYVEGVDDKRWYGILAGPSLCAEVDFVMPSEDFPGSKDGHEGVVEAVRRRKSLSTSELCFGLCDGDALAAKGAAYRLLSSTGAFVDRLETDGEINYLAYHEIENVIFCDTEGVEKAFFSFLGRDRYLKQPEHRHQLWHDLSQKALELFERAMHVFASEIAWLEGSHAEASIRQGSIFHERIAAISEALQCMVAGVEQSRKHSWEEERPGYDRNVFRLCMGKELLNHLRGMINQHDIFTDMAFADASNGQFGEWFRSTMYQTVNRLKSAVPRSTPREP